MNLITPIPYQQLEFEAINNNCSVPSNLKTLLCLPTISHRIHVDHAPISWTGVLKNFVMCQSKYGKYLKFWLLLNKLCVKDKRSRLLLNFLVPLIELPTKLYNLARKCLPWGNLNIFCRSYFLHAI